jgi:glutamyl-tRNA synthetase
MPSNQTTNNIRVRFAPSPTGFLHVGSARTALYNFLFARSHDAKIILRIEDTDTARHNSEGEKDIYESLKWLGINWDEGPDIGGPYGPYKQSERTTKYEDAVKNLLKSGGAYRCFCSANHLDEMRKKAEIDKLPFRYDEKCRNISKEKSEERAQTEPFVVRLRVDLTEPIVVDDIIRGKVEFPIEAIDDFVISKGEDKALYHLAVVVDDADMEITHIIRGEDGLSNTPKHICLQRALGFSTPEYAHIPLLLDESRKKLSKRSGEVSMFVKTLREEQGYLPEAVVNGLALLGWNPKTDQDVFSLDELITQFKLENVQKGGAIFSLEKFQWFNKHHIKKMSADDLFVLTKNFIERSGVSVENDFLKKFLEIEKERIMLIGEVPALLSDILKKPVLDETKIAWRESNKEVAINALKIFLVETQKITDETWGNKEELQKNFLAIADASQFGRAAVLWPVRYVLTGKEKSAGPHEIAWLLGKEETIKRITAAVV